LLLAGIIGPGGIGGAFSAFGFHRCGYLLETVLDFNLACGVFLTKAEFGNKKPFYAFCRRSGRAGSAAAAAFFGPGGFCRRR